MMQFRPHGQPGDHSYQLSFVFGFKPRLGFVIIDSSRRKQVLYVSGLCLKIFALPFRMDRKISYLCRTIEVVLLLSMCPFADFLAVGRRFASLQHAYSSCLCHQFPTVGLLRTMGLGEVVAGDGNCQYVRSKGRTSAAPCWKCECAFFNNLFFYVPFPEQDFRTWTSTVLKMVELQAFADVCGCGVKVYSVYLRAPQLCGPPHV